MFRFVGVRLLQSLAALAILTVVVFVLARATGDPLHMILPMSATAEDYANARAYLGLDRPYLEQYLSFVGKALTGDFGNSIRARKPVIELLRERLPNSVKLAVFAMTVSLAMAFPLGVMAAVKKDSSLDRLAQVIAVLGQSLPTFWVAHMSHTIAVMYLGKIVELGDADAVALAPKHPYTQALFAAALPIDLDGPREEVALSGEVPSALDPPNGCRFHPRCAFAMPHCATDEPALRSESGRLVACHLY